MEIFSKWDCTWTYMLLLLFWQRRCCCYQVRNSCLKWSCCWRCAATATAAAVVVIIEPFASSEIPNITQFHRLCPISFNVFHIKKCCHVFFFYLSFRPSFVGNEKKVPQLYKNNKTMFIYTNTQTNPNTMEKKPINMFYGMSVCVSACKGGKKWTIIKFILLIFVCRSHLFVMTKSRAENRQERKKIPWAAPTTNIHCSTNNTVLCRMSTQYMGHIDDIFLHFNLDLTP